MHRALSLAGPLTPGLTVAICVYRGGATLRRALESIDQALLSWSSSGRTLDLRLVCVLDGEDGKCLELLKAHQAAATYRVHIDEQPHRGLPATKNRCVELVATSHLTFLDCDDELLPGRLDQAARFAPEIVCGSQVFSYGGDFDLPAGVPSQHNQGAPRPHFGSAIVPRSVFDLIGGYDEDLPIGSEVDVLMRAKAYGITITIEETITIRRWVTGLNLSRDREGAMQDIFSALRKNIS